MRSLRGRKGKFIHTRLSGEKWMIKAKVIDVVKDNDRQVFMVELYIMLGLGFFEIKHLFQRNSGGFGSHLFLSA